VRRIDGSAIPKSSKSNQNEKWTLETASNPIALNISRRGAEGAVEGTLISGNIR
jgi:hypothetical protein